MFFLPAHIKQTIFLTNFYFRLPAAVYDLSKISLIGAIFLCNYGIALHIQAAAWKIDKVWPRLLAEPCFLMPHSSPDYNGIHLHR